MGSRPRRGLDSRGLGELYIMAIIIMIVIVSLAVIYSVLNGFSKYVAEEKQSLQSIRGTEVSVSLSGFNTVGSNYVITMKLSNAMPLSNAEAICRYSVGNAQYMQYCSYVINGDVVYVTVPGTLVNKGVGNLVVLVPTASGLTPGISLYRGPIEVSVIAPPVVYQGSASTVDITVLLINNSTGWVNATVIANVNGNTIANSTIMPPSGAAATSIPVGITSAGTTSIPITVLINNYTETVPAVQLIVQQSPTSTTTSSLPATCQSMAFGYIGNATTNGLQSYVYPGVGPGLSYGDEALQNSVIDGFPNPIYTYAIETGPPPPSGYTIMYYYNVFPLSIKVGNYPNVTAYVYPVDFTTDAIPFFFIVTNNHYAIVIYWQVGTSSPSSLAISNIDAGIGSLTVPNGGNIKKFFNVNGGTIPINAWTGYTLDVTNYVGSNVDYQYVGFGIYLPNTSQSQGQSYWDYICIG
ncbi:hypothetical protein [Vulcanisaeta distributa]|uniref:Uncharacterized protein n=1 Tax=Vulcanisaeta distributa (strain DSM 14429 / JCM 11212 / NBRC 100878 / IC-017) TaxID=572478 RepID=E1QQI4_VULDI|nr:hypothetical protein [Vulcanisaeta distributa]ADN50479.1 conserved hypothetical protein [Vulcanisaeta distributa DSM 14429]